MIKYLLPLLLALAPAALTAEDCAGLDACAGGKVASPFAAASLREPLPPAAPGSGGKKAALRQTAPPAAPAAPAPAEPETRPAGEQLGSPLWLLFVGGVLAGLYFYLGAGRKKGRRK
jgi:hypothetical protein